MTTQHLLHVVAAAIIVSRRCLIGQRPKGGSAGELWEFPGGKVEEGETPEAALIREIREELEVDIDVGPFLGRSVIEDDQRKLVLDLYRATWKSGEFRAHAHLELAWVDEHLPDAGMFAPADRPLLELVAEHLREAGRSG